MNRQISLENDLFKLNHILDANPSDFNVYIQRGMVRFKLALINQSIQDFDAAAQLKPSIVPYLWQRGLSLYYAERFADGAKQFETDLKVNAQDGEETIWRYLCLARVAGVKEAQNSLLVIPKDSRFIIRRIYDFYTGNCSEDELLVDGKKEGKRGLFYSHLYLGLFYEVSQDIPLAKKHILLAAEEYPLQDYMWHLAIVHKQLREW